MKVLIVVALVGVGWGVIRWRLALLERRRFDRWLTDQDRRDWAQGIDGPNWTWPVKR